MNTEQESADHSEKAANEQWRQAKAIQHALNRLIAEALPASGLCQEVGPVINAVQQRDGEGRSALAGSFPLIKRKKRKDVIVAWLNYQISLFGNGVPPCVVDGVEQPYEPVLHVAHWTCEFSFEYDAYIGFPAQGWQPWRNEAQRLLCWGDSDSPYGDEWTYSLRLAQMEGDEALQRCVIAPALALLEGAPAAEALPDDLPGLVFYQDKELGDGERDLLAVDAPSTPA
ncbi:hypothetical protein [Pseudogulbenkiania subflava]|uniref:Uncharacterized protein n=1 Tax=Pseudogulbenkiania subflava DSM 22618 TaxID=1123014 RepID=A0A1Y6C1H0_9NEIS|nr:hypothetical protein [Pseudogulbenkiania subflava]SMF38716.1 hypothetical protein SAMN02745746_02923 [Pseudogulbenkiania subflava DSM 22618]